MMRKKTINIIDNRYGRLHVIKEIGTGKNYDRLFLCRCECGTEKSFSMSDLRKGNTKSCGCKNVDHLKVVNEVNESLRVDGIQPLALIRKTPSHNKSTGMKGITIEYTKKGKERFRAYISVGKKKYRLGNHDSLEEAIIARNKGEEKYHQPILKKSKVFELTPEEAKELLSDTELPPNMKKIIEPSDEGE
jgi:hypothetical protein